MKWIETLKIILLGVLEGVTEWLPVSSTGHMLLFDAAFTLPFDQAFKEVFLYFIQLCAVLAVVVLFWKRLFPLQMTGAGTSRKQKITLNRPVVKIWGKVLFACIPSLVGLFVDIPESPILIAAMLILYGIAFIVVENCNRRRVFLIESVDGVTYRQAFIIGCFQVLAILPGTSRSGATILGALLLGIARPAAAEFTFFLAIPTMVGASAVKILQYALEVGRFAWVDVGYLLVGSAVAFLVSLLTIRGLMNFVKKHDFTHFGWYRIALGALVLCAVFAPIL